MKIMVKKDIFCESDDEWIPVVEVEKEFDDITGLAATICQVPISIITFLDSSRQYFKSSFGLDSQPLPLEFSFCKHAIKKPNEILVIEDARSDERFKDNPNIPGEAEMIFYAGIPLVLSSGKAIGTLCVIDTRPRNLSDDQLKSLKALANQVEKLLELNQNQIKLQHTQSQLSKETERLNNIIRATNVGTWEWNVQTGEVEYNERWAEMIGYTLAELSPVNVNTWQKFIHPEDFELAEQKTNDCFTKKSEYHDIECRMIHKDGAIIWVNDFGRVIKWTEEGEPLLMSGTHTDITAKVLARENTKRFENRFKVLVENGADAVAIIGGDGVTSYVSPSITRVLGYTEEEALKLNLFEIIHPEDVAGVSAKMEEVIINPGIPIYGHTSRTKHKDGSWRYLEATITNLLDDPSINGIVDNFRDVTEQVLDEQKLKASEENYKTLFQYSPLPKFVYDIDSFQILDANEHAIDLYGFSRNEFLGMSMKDLTHDTGIEELLKFDEELTENRKDVQLGIKEHFKQNGERILVDITGHTNYYDGKKCMMIVCQDVTEREHYLESLKSSEHKFSIAASLAKLGYWKYEIDLKKLTWSDEVYRIWGRGKDFELSFPGLMKTIHPDDQKSFLEKQKLSINEEMDHDIVYRIILPDGQIKWVRELGRLLKDENGKSVVFDGAVQDITKQKTEEQQIKMLQEIVTKTTDAIVITEAQPVDEPGPRILYVNEAFTTMTGYLASEVIGKSPRMLQGPKTDKGQLKKLSEAIRNWKPCEITVVNYRKNSEEYWVNLKVNPVADVFGRYTHLVSIQRDVTEQKNKELEKDLLNKIGTIFRQNHDLAGCLTKLSEYLVRFGSFDFVEIWVPDVDNNMINCITRYSESTAGNTFNSASGSLKSLARGEGLPGYIWENGKTEIWESNDAQGHIERRTAAQKSKINVMMGLPLSHNEEVIGILLLGTAGSNNALAFYSKILQKSAKFIGSELSRKKLEIELAQIFDFAPDMICVSGFDGYLKRINPAGVELLGYSLEEIYSKPIISFVHEADRLITKEKQKELSYGAGISNFENRYITKDGKVVWLSWTSTPMLDHGIVYAVAKDITDKKELLRLVDAANRLSRIGSWEVNFLNQTFFWSPMVYEIHEVKPGYSHDINNLVEFFDEDFHEMIQGLLEACMATGKSFDFEARIVTPKGNSYWTRTIGQAELIDGKCVRIYGSIQDIDIRVRADEDLKKSYQEKNNILESIGDAFYAVDRNWVVTYWNKQAELILDKAKESIIGKNLWEKYHYAIDSESYRQLNKAMSDNVQISFEEYYAELHKWFEISAYPSEDGMSVYFKDTTLRKEADIEILKANERFEKVTEATSDAIWDWDIQNDSFFRSNGFEKLFGHGFKKLFTSSEFWKDGFHSEDLPKIQMGLTEALENKKIEKWEQEYRILHSDGSVKTVNDRGVIIRDHKGKAIRMVGAVTDISYRKQHERELLSLNESLKEYAHNLEISNEQLEQFAFIASHDLQEPLRMITSFLSQLERKYETKLDEKALQYIHFATDGAKRMRQIILDLLEYSKAGNLNESIELVDMGEIFTDYTLLRRKLIEEKSVKITAANLLVVSAFKAPLVQTVHCLLDNAIKYARKGVSPVVEFIIIEREEDWLFTIKDNGIGISKEFFEKIFVIFQRLHNRDEYEGTGIGLSIAKKNVESWGGKIWLESLNDQGSTFHFTLSKKPFFKKAKSVV
jgi:PAS domain S-box-containing protein